MLLFSVFFIAFAIFHNRKMIANHEQVQRLEKEKSRKNLVNAIEIQETERARIGADIHDDLGPTMVAIKLKLGRFTEGIAPSEKDLDQLDEMIEETIMNVRGLSQSMYPNTLEKYGLVDAIKQMIGRIQSFSPITIIDKISPKIEDLSKVEQLSFFRILQEFCNNSIKHSGCDTIKIDILESKGDFTVKLSDNGKGFKKEDLVNPGIGLRNMEMRAKAIDYSFDLQSNSEGSSILLKSRSKSHEG